MDATPNLNLPFIIAAQAQKHVTHNEALRALDAIVQLVVADKDLDTPPGSPADGACYIVAASPTGSWSGQAGSVAAFQDGAWAFYAPREGWLAWVADEATLYVWNGSAWAVFAGGGGGGGLANLVEDATPQLGGALDANGHGIGFDDGTGLTDDAGNTQLVLHKTASAVNGVGLTNAATGAGPQIAAEGSDTDIDLTLAGKGTGHPRAALFGVNATADATTKFAVAAEASLFNHVGNGHQHKINKAAAGDTACLLFQTGTSGRAEMGTAGDDDFHFKVSADGSAWKEAIVIDRTSGAVSMPLTPRREVLAASRTYYVRTDGSDSNDGLADSSGAAFLTVQKAIDMVGGLDVAIHDVTISIASGTYAGAITLKNFAGAGRCTLTCPSGTATLSRTGGNLLYGNLITSRYALGAGIALTTTTSGSCIYLEKSALAITGAVAFGACASVHMVLDASFLTAEVSYSITGGAAFHVLATTGSQFIWFGSITVTLTGTPAFSSTFVRATIGSVVRAVSITFSGSATGARYSALMNSVISTNGAGTSYFPGSSAGSTATGGQYE